MIRWICEHNKTHFFAAIYFDICEFQRLIVEQVLRKRVLQLRQQHETTKSYFEKYIPRLGA